MAQGEKRRLLDFWKIFALFSVILLLILIGLNELADYYFIDPYEWKYEEIYNPKVNAQAIILGPSNSVSGINPKYLESDDLRFYNFSLHGANPIFYLRWYNDLYRVYSPNKPSVIIFTSNWFLFNETWLWRRFKHDCEFWPFGLYVKLLIESYVSKKLAPKKLLDNRFPLFKNQKDIILLKERTLNIYDIEKVYKGYIPAKIEGDAKKGDLTLKYVKMKYYEDQVSAFRKLLHEFKQDGIQVILIQTPEYIKGRIIEGDYDKDLVKKIAKEFDLPYLNYNEEKVSEINYNPDAFRDWAHMSDLGAELFSKKLKDDLELIFANKKIAFHKPNLLKKWR